MKVQEFFSYLCVNNAAKAIEFYKEAFGAKEKFRLTEPNGRIGHAELDFGCACMMISDEFPEYGVKAPSSDGTRTYQLHLHVDNADEFIKRSVTLGAEIVHEVGDKFYGERSGTIRDPFGHHWNIGHEIEKMAPKEMQYRYDEMAKDGNI